MKKEIFYLERTMNLEKICTEIMESDKEIIMIAVSYRTDSYYMEREGTESLQTKENVEKSLADAVLRWVTRRCHRTLVNQSMPWQSTKKQSELLYYLEDMG
jgi:hypothetical protein